MHYDIHEDAAVVAKHRGTTLSDIWEMIFALSVAIVPMLVIGALL